MEKPTWYIVIGRNVYGQSPNSLKEALKSAVNYYGSESAKKDRARFKAMKVTDDFEICLTTGLVEATQIVRIGYFNWSGTVLED